MQTLTQELTFSPTLKNMYQVHCLVRYLGTVRRTGKQWAAKARRHGATETQAAWSGPYSTRGQAGEALRDRERKWIE